MRILFTFIGGLGHFDPLEPVARACVAAGHDVAVSCSGGLTARVGERGFLGLATSAPRPPGQPVRDLAPIPAVDAHAAEVEFAENFAEAYAGTRWIDKERARLTAAVEAAEGSEPR